MKRQRVVIIANTVYQMIVAIQLTNTLLKQMEVDLIISDHSLNVFKYVRSGKKTGIFHDIKYVQSLEYSRRYGKYEITNEFQELLYVLQRFAEVKKIYGSIPDYDMVIASNLDYFTFAFYDTVKILKNRNVRFYMYEDGLSTYKATENILNDCRRNFKEKRYANIYRLTGYGQLLNEIRGAFLFNPEMFAWKEKIKKFRIPKIDKTNKKIVHILNTFFGYKDCNSEFENKNVIFFEESFNVDGHKSNDLKLLHIIAENVGKENVLVKMHPRSSINRFEGYDVCSVSNIPWEVMFLNGDFSEKKLISISSGSIIHPFIVFGDKTPVIVLQDVANMYIDTTIKIYQKFLKEQVFQKYPDVFCMPGSVDELKKVLKKNKGDV